MYASISPRALSASRTRSGISCSGLLSGATPACAPAVFLGTAAGCYVTWRVGERNGGLIPLGPRGITSFWYTCTLNDM